MSDPDAKATERRTLALLVSRQEVDDLWSGAAGHKTLRLTVTFVSTRPDGTELRGLYWDQWGTRDGIPAETAAAVDGLTISTFVAWTGWGGGDQTPGYHVYDHHTDYREPYDVPLARAEAMVRALRKLARYQARRDERDGPAESFGAACVRVGACFGATRMLWRDPQDTYRGSTYDRQLYRSAPLGRGAAVVNGMIAGFIHTHTTPEERGARAPEGVRS
jgi:hypothetical protein